MVATDLSRVDDVQVLADRNALPVLLSDGDSASGLAEMLHQYLEQTIASSGDKAKAARALRGRVVFRAAEDESIAVTISFRGDCVELRDGVPSEKTACVKADFLTVAHLASGEENPIGLLFRRRLAVRGVWGNALFLWRVAELLRLQERSVYLLVAVFAGVLLFAATCVVIAVQVSR